MDIPTRRDLTDDEIKSLDFEMKICFMLQGWNKSINPKTISDWAKLVGWYGYKYKEHTAEYIGYEDAVSKASDDAIGKIEFLGKFL